MGRRKERRLAGISAAGRRVKLDLFAEPSGDMGGSSPQEEVGGDGDSKIHAELASSPSSSGKQPQNPLLLLEQYSDEELDEDSNDVHNHATAEDASVDIYEQAKNANEKETKDVESDPSMQKVEQHLMVEDFPSQDPSQKLDNGGITVNDSDDLLGGTNKLEDAAYPAITSSTQLVGALTSGWKMVLHEESYQYYYWNVTTGETSWEVPDDLALETVTTSVDKSVLDIEEKTVACMSSFNANTLLDAEQDDITTSEPNGDFKIICETNAGEETEMGGSNEGLKLDSFDGEDEKRDTDQSHGTSLPGDTPVTNSSNGAVIDLSSRLVKHCESMLERLNSVKGMNCDLEGQDLKLKCTLETEIRLADMKALASHGSSLLPFWLHYEDQLKRLEGMIDDVILRCISSSTSELESASEPHVGVSENVKVDPNRKKLLLPAVESPSKSIYVSQYDGATPTQHVTPVEYHPTSSVNQVERKNETSSIVMESELTLEPDTHSGEEIDMDVDMEVEEDLPTSISVAHYNVSSEPSYPHSTRNQEPGQVFTALPPEGQWVPPPPPDDEPLPPPPPDDGPFPPPPPPDEPPEISDPPVTQSEAIQSYSYSEHYSLSYPGSGLEYYGQIQPDGTTLYMRPDGVQVAVPHLPHYYEAVPNAYSVAPLVVNPIEANAYYGLDNATLNLASLTSASAVESFAIQSVSIPENRDSDIGGSSDSHAETGSSLLVKSNLNGLRSGDEIVKSSLAVPDTHPFVGAPENSPVMNSISVSSSYETTTCVATAMAATTSKVQPKASRSKKRTAAVVSSLRPSKKVSSLVDKWKAVKEGLQEEEEEPEDAYEILEKKKQREIEEWRAKQIASGEAKVNANFQPLGGDWREIVKRKLARKKKESRQSPSDIVATTDGNQQKQQPDLVELSRGLPSGWQAYWDDSTKQVYYGSTLTSETTWTRPTD